MAGAHTTFTNGVTLTDAGWFQDVDTVAYTLFGNGTSYTGVLTLAGTTQSTSTSTGQAIIAGGMGLAKNLWVGGTGNFAGAVTLQSTLTLGGTVSGGGNQINNVIIGSSTPLAGSFTTLSASSLLDLSSAAAGQVKFPATQNASSNANTLDDYDEYTAASAACTGAITSSVVWKLTKVGNVVTLTLPATNGTATATPSWDYGTVIPAKYRPAANIHWAVPMKNNGAYQSSPGAIFVASSTGIIQCYRLTDFTSNFTNGANAGTDYAMSVSWTI